MAQKFFPNTQLAFGTVGGAFGPRTAVSAGSNTSVALPRGWWLVETDANTTVRFTYDAGSTFVTWLAASDAEIIFSDGFNVEVRGGASAGTARRSQILNLT